ncbi:MAG: YfiR family protein [Acidobacteriota bacterium]|nr:YfiR family protein [Acidobacteriota bacterium]
MMTATGRTVFRAVALLLVLVLLGTPAPSQDKAPPNIQAALFMKLLAFYTNLGSDPFTIHVVGAPNVAKALKTYIGKKAGKAKLKSVTEGSGPPNGVAQIVYVGQDAGTLTKYCQANGVLSITGISKYVNEGVTLGIGVENGKPKILLNLSSTKAENINWNPQILKVASTID